MGMDFSVHSTHFIFIVADFDFCILITQSKFWIAFYQYVETISLFLHRRPKYSFLVLEKHICIK